MDLKSNQKIQATFSMSSMTDIIFLLLIFFLVATRFAEEERELDVLLPDASEAQPLTSKPGELFINIDQEGRYYVTGKILTLDELHRTLKTATHEIGHMFSMQHCTEYECNMCGSNSRAESDRRPLALCPDCLAKLCWATKADPKGRFGRLAAFCKKHGLKNEQELYERSLAALGKQ